MGGEFDVEQQEVDPLMIESDGGCHPESGAAETVGDARPARADSKPAPSAPPDSHAPLPPAPPALPVQSQDETDVGWSERSQSDDDERLPRERPPHWDFT